MQRCAVRSCGEPLRQRLVHPHRTFGRAPLGALGRGQECRLDDDAVGVVDAQHSLVLDGAVDLGPHRRPEVDGDGADLVDRTLPARDAQAGLLLDLAGEALEERLALLDHAPRRRPVVAAVAPAVLHEQHSLVAQDEPRTDDPVAHEPILARW